MRSQSPMTWTPNRLFAFLVGIVFLLVGILSFIVLSTDHCAIQGYSRRRAER